MNWFKSIWLTSEERRILKEAKQNKGKTITPTAMVSQEEITEVRPYSKLLYSNKNLTVIFPDGDIISSSDISMDIFDLVKSADTKDRIKRLLIGEPPVAPIQEETKEEKQLVKDNLSVFREHQDFTIKDGEVYLKGVNLVLPAAVCFSFIEIIERIQISMSEGANRDVIEQLEEQYEALKMFWLKLALSPLEQSRKDLLTFIRKNDVRITRNGNLVLYRRIVSTGTTDKTLTAFVSQAYYDRKKQKKAQTHPRNYNVVKVDGTLQIIKLQDSIEGAEVLGNLLDMYKNLEKLEENTFRSQSSGKNGQLPIKIGTIYNIPDDEINLDNGNCAAGGLHAAAVNYDYSGFGDTPVVVLVNPSKAITVPINEVGKMRTTEMFIACVNDKKKGIHFDEDALSAFDEEYHDLTLGQLEEAVRSKKFTSLQVKDKKPVVDLVDVEKIKEILRTRVQLV